MEDTRLEKSIFRFILRYSRRDQIYLTFLTVLMFPILYAALELPKIIINQAIGGTEFPREVFGFSFDQIPFLWLLSFMFLGLIALYGGLKYYVSVYRGKLGERMLRRLRYQLYGRVLRFPLPHFKKVGSGEIIPMITAEVEPLGEFIGDALALPIMQAGTLATYMVFIFIQDFWLGLAAIALYPFQMYLIPKLQRRVNLLNKERVKIVRKLSDRIGESVLGAQEIHASDGSRLLRADVSNRLNTIFEIRYEMFRRKFFIKFLNNFLGQLTPFFFYAVGGYFVIQQELSFGALVAVIAAYKDLASPWKELLQFYQKMEDVRIKYEQVVEQFEPAGMLDEKLQTDLDESAVPVDGPIVASNVQLSEDGRIFQIDNATFTIEPGESVAIVGPSGSGKDELAQLMARLLINTGGSLQLGSERFSDLPETYTGQRIGYVGANAFLFSATVYENLTLGLKHRPVVALDYADDAADERKTFMAEADITGNTIDDVHADWIDYAAAGVDDQAGLTKRIEDVLRQVDLDRDIYVFGLRGTIDPDEQPKLAEKFLEARHTLRDRLNEPAIRQLVEPFDMDRYNTNASLAENLLFGTPKGEAFDLSSLADNPYVMEILDREGLTDDLLKIGYQVAETMVELFADLPAGHEFFSQYSFISSDDLPDVQATVGRTSIDQLDQLRDEERSRLLSLPFFLIERRHRLDLIDSDMKERILKARRAFAENLPEESQGAIEFFRNDQYNAAASIQDNILFGKIAYGQAQAEDKIRELIGSTIEALELRDEVIEAGLNYECGIGGGRLTSQQRQKLAIARCLLKRPDWLIVNEATASLDSAAQTKILENVIAERKEKSLIWVVHRAGLAKNFEKLIVMSGGRIAEQGTYQDLAKDGTAFQKLAAGD